MSKILYWTELAKNLKEKIIQKRIKYFSSNSDFYVWIIFIWDNSSSVVYVEKKKKFGEDIWLGVKIFWQTNFIKGGKIERWKDGKINGLDLSYNQICEIIDFLNEDEKCVWIVLQQPMWDLSWEEVIKLVCRVNYKKDIDWLWGHIQWLSTIWLINFLPATSKSVYYLLDQYGFGDMKWKKVSVIWQWIVSWKPIMLEAIKRWATVFSFNHNSDQKYMAKISKESDYIISCTWKVHLVTSDFIRNDQSQIIVDVGYGHRAGKPVWDVDIENIKDKVLAYTPIPWWIWPLTVACLFDNVFDLQELKGI